MKKIYKRIVLIFSLIVLGIFINFTDVDAASASISASSTNVNVGDKVTITVSATGCLSTLSVSGPGISGSIDIVNTNLENETKTATYTLDTSSAGSKTINLTGSIVDADKTESTIGKSVTVTVAEKPAQTTTPTENQQPTTPSQPATPTQPTTPAEPTFSSTSKTMYTTGNINLRSSWSTSSQATSVPAGTEVTVTGTSTDNINGFVWYRVSYNGQTKYVASSLLTATKPEEKTDDKEDKEDDKKEKSTNKALKDLVIENYKLTPDFDPDITKYSVEVSKKVEKLEISAITEDENAKVEVTGNSNFKVGTNTVKVTVTAEDGTKRTYTISVTKTNSETDDVSSKLKLKSLEIKNATLSPSFSSDETNYTISVSDPSSIKAEDIIAIAEDSDVNVKVALSEDGASDERLITIMLEKKDGEEQQTGSYQIVVKKAVFNPIANINKKDNKIYYILGGIIAVLLVLIIVIIVLLRRTSPDDDDELYDEDDSELDDDYDYSLKKAIDKANNEEYDDMDSDYDDIVENSGIKSQILNAKDYNVFENDDMEDETRKYDFIDDENPDFNSKKRGKHF